MNPSRQAALWDGRFQSPAADAALALSGSLEIDLPLADHDVAASRAHVAELRRLELLGQAEADRLDDALVGVARRLADGSFAWHPEHEDIHMNVEAAVIEAVGSELGGMLQAGRSRNDEIVTDERRWLATATTGLIGAVRALQSVLLARAETEAETILPAHTHTQPAQPVVLAHHLLAYVEMLDRDAGRLADASARADRSPAGSGAVAGSGLPLDRHRVAAELGFGGVTDNSIDAVSDRDYAIETVAALAILLGHLSRLAGELVLWSTPYVGFARLDDAFSSGSSMLPNKRNPDSAELVRARAARVEGDLVVLLSLVRGLPLAYHRDLQETRRAMFDAVDSARLCTEVMRGVMAGVTFNRDRMRSAAEGGHARAVILADRLVARGVAFREAHRRIGHLVATAEASGVDLAELPDAALQAALPELEGAPMPTLEESVAAADVHGGTAPQRVRSALDTMRERLGREEAT
ncbi:MAG TPA: argininosuccinate lyase [Candidatus Limnocylindrales bacterium]|nr:argininosuccinate lyase [Candidatus Limnocylindrales bacterium]